MKLSLKSLANGAILGGGIALLLVVLANVGNPKIFASGSYFYGLNFIIALWLHGGIGGLLVIFFFRRMGKI